MADEYIPKKRKSEEEKYRDATKRLLRKNYEMETWGRFLGKASPNRGETLDEYKEST